MDYTELIKEVDEGLKKIITIHCAHSILNENDKKFARNLVGSIFHYLDKNYNTDFNGRGIDVIPSKILEEHGESELEMRLSKINLLAEMDLYPNSVEYRMKRIRFGLLSIDLYRAVIQTKPPRFPKNLAEKINTCKVFLDSLSVAASPDAIDHSHFHDLNIFYNEKFVKEEFPRIFQKLNQFYKELKETDSEYLDSAKKFLNSFPYCSEDIVYFELKIRRKYSELKQIIHNEKLDLKIRDKSKKICEKYDEILGLNLEKEDIFYQKVQQHGIFPVVRAIKRKRLQRDIKETTVQEAYEFFNKLI